MQNSIKYEHIYSKGLLQLRTQGKIVPKVVEHVSSALTQKEIF
jgi:hypothetical protein